MAKSPDHANRVIFHRVYGPRVTFWDKRVGVRFRSWHCIRKTSETTNVADHYPDKVKELQGWTTELAKQAAPPLFPLELVYGPALPAMLIGGMMVPSVGHAQYMINMSLVTCMQYVAMPPDQSRIFSAWMSGWFNQKSGYTYINLQAYERNLANMKAWCAANPNELVMTGLHRAMAK